MTCKLCISSNTLHVSYSQVDICQKPAGQLCSVHITLLSGNTSTHAEVMHNSSVMLNSCMLGHTAMTNVTSDIKWQLSAPPVINFALVNMPQKNSNKSVINKAAAGPSISVEIGITTQAPRTKTWNPLQHRYYNTLQRRLIRVTDLLIKSRLLESSQLVSDTSTYE